MDAALTLACGLEVEERRARRAGARVARVGLGAGLPLPDGRIVAFGLAGALVPGLPPGTLVSATRIVSAEGDVLWAGEPLPVEGALHAAVCASDHVVDDPAERRALAERTGAVAVDMESGRLARSGRLAGSVRAISDTPDRPVGRLASAAHGDGTTDWRAVLRAFLVEPVATARSVRSALQGFSALERAAGSLR